MFRVAVCDDDMLVCSQIEKIVNEWNDAIQIDIFYSGEQFYKFLENEIPYDLIFLDIEMDALSGVDLGKKLREELNNHIVKIIYISSKESYAMDLFKIRTFDFLVKPLQNEDIISNIKQVMEICEKTKMLFEFTSNGVQHRVAFEDILFFESEGRKVKLVTIDDSRHIYTKLSKIAAEIQNEYFAMVHRSFFVNFMQVKQYSYEQLIMQDNSVIPISQQYRKGIRSYFLGLRGAGL